MANYFVLIPIRHMARLSVRSRVSVCTTHIAAVVREPILHTLCKAQQMCISRHRESARVRERFDQRQ